MLEESVMHSQIDLALFSLRIVLTLICWLLLAHKAYTTRLNLQFKVVSWSTKNANNIIKQRPIVIFIFFSLLISKTTRFYSINIIHLDTIVISDLKQNLRDTEVNCIFKIKKKKKEKTLIKNKWFIIKK